MENCDKLWNLFVVKVSQIHIYTYKKKYKVQRPCLLGTVVLSLDKLEAK